jgi:hypothetical protein
MNRDEIVKLVAKDALALLQVHGYATVLAPRYKNPDEYIKGDKANGYTVTKAKKGFVIRIRSNHQGALTDGVYWVRYRDCLPKTVNLHAFINEDSPVTYGEWVFQHLPDRVLKSGRRVY